MNIFLNQKNFVGELQMDNKSGKKAGILYFIATLFNKGIAFLTIPIFSKFLTTSDYGIVTTYKSWVDILTVILSLALYMSLRTAFLDYKDKINNYLSTIVSFTCMFGVICGSIIVLVGKYILKIDVYMIILVLIQGLSCAVLMDYTQYLMMDFKYVKRTIYMIFPNLLSVIISIIVIVYMDLEKVYMGRIIPMVIVNVAFCFIILCRVYACSKPSINKEYIKYGLSFSLPLVLHGIALNVLSQSDRTMITLLAGADQTGIYSLVYTFGMVATVITTALEGIWIPWFYMNLKNHEDKKINEKANDYIKLMAYAMIALMLLGPEIYKFLADSAYWDGISIIPPIVLANFVIFMYTLYINIEHYHKKTKRITAFTLIAAICNIILNFIFIPPFGYVAAGYTTLASYIISFLLHAQFAKRLEKNVIPVILFIKPICIITLTVVIYYILLEHWLARWCIMFLFAIIVLIRDRNTLKTYLVNVQNK